MATAIKRATSLSSSQVSPGNQMGGYIGALTRVTTIVPIGNIDASWRSPEVLVVPFVVDAMLPFQWNRKTGSEDLTSGIYTWAFLPPYTKFVKRRPASCRRTSPLATWIKTSWYIAE